jgi:preprotein translocase subunit SecY
MKGLFQTIRNIFKIKELKSRIFITLGFILVYRLCAFVTLPMGGTNRDALADSLFSETSSEGLLGILNLFTGGALSQASIMALGIMPYISASIVIQLLGIGLPYIQKLQKEGQSGRNKITQLTRYLTILICAFQAPGYIYAIEAMSQNLVSIPFGSFVWIVCYITLITGTLFAMWIGERITDRGLGNGISILIMIGIIANLPASFASEFTAKLANTGGVLVIVLLELIVLLLVILVSILLVQGTRKIPVQFAKRVVGNRQFGGVRQFIPLKVNAAGVMPIIFAQALMFLPATFSMSAEIPENGFLAWLKTSFASSESMFGFEYNFVFFWMIVAFTYFYTAVTVNSSQMAEDMKRNGGFIPGVKPGRQTSDYLDSVMSRIVFPGSLFLAFVAILPAFAAMFGVDRGFAQFYGGTSLLIMVGVVLDTLQQIEGYLLNRHYDGLMKGGGRIKGKSSM